MVTTSRTGWQGGDLLPGPEIEGLHIPDEAVGGKTLENPIPEEVPVRSLLNGCSNRPREIGRIVGDAPEWRMVPVVQSLAPD